jgi:hypothetical protein
LETWVAIGIALDRPLAVAFGRDVFDPLPRDAGHLTAQELLLRYATDVGRTGQFELSTRPGRPAQSVDVCLVDRRQRTLILIEVWNRLDDLGAAARSTDRKMAEARDLAAATDPPRRVAGCWVLVDNAANRQIVRRYPAILRSRFPGSSAGWVRALTSDAPPPIGRGVLWANIQAGRLAAVHLRA